MITPSTKHYSSATSSAWSMLPLVSTLLATLTISARALALMPMQCTARPAIHASPPSRSARMVRMNAGSLAEQVKLAVSRGASAPLDTCPAVCGAVATGFGRGSKKLGVPTANLPCSLFQTTLNDLSCGVYIGWAVVRGSLYKCVANIGFSPTFVDAENPEKMVEAHLLHVFHDDFYHEPLALLLVGFIRPERKFNSFDELVTTIRADIETARSELDQPPYASMRHAQWLRSKLITPELDSTGAVFELLPPADLLADEPSTADGIIVGLPPAGFEWGSIF